MTKTKLKQEIQSLDVIKEKKQISRTAKTTNGKLHAQLYY